MNGADALLFNCIPAYRATEIESRQHRFHVVTPAERKARRKRCIEAALIVVGLGAFAAICYGLCSPKPGAIINSQVAPGAPLTAENAPVRWQRKDFPPKQTPSSKRVASNTANNPARVNDNSPAPGIGVKRKAKP